ncbi:MAG: cell surface protein SprA, partial [Longimicrobiales bacterium]
LTRGIPAGNFGFMASGQIGPIDFQTVWAQQRGDVSTSEFRLAAGGQGDGLVQDDQIVLDDADYVEGQFFFLTDPATLIGAPHIDVLALVAGDAPATVRPAHGGTIQIFRDERAALASGPQQAQLGLFLADATSADGTLTHTGQFRRLIPDEDYLIHSSGLWIMLRSPLRSDEALAISYVTETGDTIGTLNAESVPAGTTPTLRLLRSPVASHQPGRPTWDYEMHQVYRLNASSQVEQQSIDLVVSLGDAAGGQTFRDVGGQQVTFLRLFGLDDDSPADLIDGAQIYQPNRDVQDGGGARINGTFVIFPTLQPFLEPPPVPSASLSAEEARAVLGGDANNDIYTNPDPVLRDGGTRFRLNFTYRVRVEGLVSSFNLGQFGIREGSERLTFAGRALERGVDYTIDYEIGQVTLSDPASLFGATPAGEIRATWEQKALFQIAPTSVFGMNARYRLGPIGELNFVGLYQSEKTLYSRPQLGVEPGAAFLGGASARLDLGGQWLDGMLDRVPGLRLAGPSAVALDGEVAFSLPNPNRAGAAYLDDFEGTDEVPLDVRRQQWNLGSQPGSTEGDEGVLPAPMSVVNAARLVWQHDISENGVISGSLLPRDRIDRQINIAGNQLPEPVMWLTFANPATPPGERVWRSITTVLSSTGRDLTRSEYLEFYVSAGGDQPLALVFDIGTVSEDAFYVDSLGNTNGTYPDGVPWGLDVLDEEASLARREVWGPEKDARGLWDQPCLAEPLTAYPFGDARSNCTRGNGVNDTEDLDGNGILDSNDGAFFRYVVPLERVSQYLVRDTLATGTDFRLYRIPLRTGAGTPVNGANEGTWRFIKHLRLTIAGEPGGTKNLALARMRIVGSRWTKRDIQG